MSDLDDLLELMHSAARRRLAVHTQIRFWQDNLLVNQAMDRWRAASGRPVVTMAIQSSDSRPPLQAEEVFEVWLQRPGPFVRVHQGGFVTLIAEQRWWGNQFADHYWTNVQPDGTIADNVGGSLPRPGLETIFDPRRVPSICTLKYAGAERVAGRDALMARGPLRADFNDLFALGSAYADETVIAVDRETGILLCVVLLLDGLEFIRWELLECAFGEEQDEAFFVGPESARFPTMDDFKQQGASGWTD